MSAYNTNRWSLLKSNPHGIIFETALSQSLGNCIKLHTIIGHLSFQYQWDYAILSYTGTVATVIIHIRITDELRRVYTCTVPTVWHSSKVSGKYWSSFYLHGFGFYPGCMDHEEGLFLSCVLPFTFLVIFHCGILWILMIVGPSQIDEVIKRLMNVVGNLASLPRLKNACIFSMSCGRDLQSLVIGKNPGKSN